MSVKSCLTDEVPENDRSMLTDEILLMEYEQRQRFYSSQNHRLDNDEKFHLHEQNVERQTDDSTNDILRNPLNSRNEEQRRGLHESEDEQPNYFSPQELEKLKKKLCWRLDPSQSLSDWELHIFNRSTKNFEIYHVHRVILSIGPRSCEFFQDVFRHEETSTTAASFNKTTRVPLIAESCKLVGCFLDYVYGNDQFEITNENALGLCYLADYFRNNSLWELATDFIEEDLGKISGLEHLAQYYTDSIYYDQDEFLDHILAVCSKELLGMMEDGIPFTKLLGELTPSHFSKILIHMEQPTGEELSSSILLTRIITEFCCMHRNELSMDSFDEFTSRITLLDSSSAITLLEASLEYDFIQDKDKNSSKRIATQNSTSSLILFQQQCIEKLSEEWEELLELDHSRVTRIMRILAVREEHQAILVEWFQKTVKRASRQLSTSRQETERVKQQNLLMEGRYKKMAERLEQAKEEAAESQRNHNTTKSEMKTQLSSWVRKNEGTNYQRQMEQQQWEHERLRWQMECQQWKHEKSKLKCELNTLRHQLGLRPQHREEYSDTNSKYSYNQSSPIARDRPILIPNDCSSSDGSSSFVSEISLNENSLLAASEISHRRDPHGLTNGMSPQFRIL